MARTFWENESPIGRRVRPFGTNWWTIVGVVADAKNHSLERPTGTELYLPLKQAAPAEPRFWRDFYVAINSTLPISAVMNSVRRELRGLDPTLPLARVRTMEEVLAAAQSRPRFLTLLLTLFSGVALLLAAVGIYGVISYSVAQRTKEFGVRIAVGAQPSAILGLVVGRGMRLAITGLIAGLAGAIILTRFLSTLLFGISPTDPVTFLAVSFLLCLVALLACYIPGRRATKVDPMVALRYE